jgi:TPR repeat protein
MASHYMEGEHTEKNVVAGADWSRKAAEQNHPPGQVQLGWCFEQGCGVPKDYESAYMWFNLAAVSEMAGAAKFRDDLAKNMTSEEIAQAQKRSREWLINFNAR